MSTVRVDQGAEAPPTRRQMQLLSQLASESGVTFAMPATMGEAHAIVGSYLSKKRHKTFRYDSTKFTYRKKRKL